MIDLLLTSVYIVSYVRAVCRGGAKGAYAPPQILKGPHFRVHNVKGPPKVDLFSSNTIAEM